MPQNERNNKSGCLWIVAVVVFLMLMSQPKERSDTSDERISHSPTGSNLVLPNGRNRTSPHAGGNMNDGNVRKQSLKTTLVPHTPIPPKKPARQAQHDWTDAIWRVENQSGYGTAFVIGRYGRDRTLLITAAHCVPDEKAKYQLVGGLAGQETRYSNVRVLRVHRAHDVALLEAPPVVPYRAIPISQWSNGYVGARVKLGGYGAGYYSEAFGKIVGSQRIPAELFGYDQQTAEAWIVGEVNFSGHSGSPAVNSDGQLVGVLSYGGGGENGIVKVRYVRWLLPAKFKSQIIDDRGDAYRSALSDSP